MYAGVCVCDSDSSVRGVSRNFAFIFKFLFVCSLLLSILYCCCMFVYKELSVVVVHLLVVFFSYLFYLFVFGLVGVVVSSGTLRDCFAPMEVRDNDGTDGCYCSGNIQEK